MATMTEYQYRTETLTANDRCDRCNSRAYVEATFKVNNRHISLMFCGHHGRQYMDGLKVRATAINDETWRLTKQVKAAAREGVSA